MKINDVVVTGKHDPALASFDDLMTSFMKTHKVPGASLAVTRQGQLMYARGFGYAGVFEEVLLQNLARSPSCFLGQVQFAME